MTTRQKEQIQNLRLLGGGSNKNRCNFVWKSLLIFYFSMPPFNFSFTFMLTMLQPWYFWSSSSRISEETECSRDKLPFSFVRGQDSTMWDIVWVSPQRHRSDTPTDRQTDNAHRHKPRLCIALRGNKTSVRPLRRSEMRSAGGSGGALRRLTVTSPTWPTERERRHRRTRRHQIRQHDAIHTYTQTQTYRETGTETVQRDRQRVSSRSANVYATDQTGLH